MLNWLWFAMMAASVVYAGFNGSLGNVLSAAVGGAKDAIVILVNLCAGYLLFCGLIEILNSTGAPARLEKILEPLIKRIMPSLCGEKTRNAVVTNIAANLLGLGNAATPSGIEAMRLMEDEELTRPRARHDMYMLLILNATGLQLVPTTVLALRAAAGSADVGAVVLPNLICTAVSTVVGVLLGLLCRGREARSL